MTDYYYKFVDQLAMFAAIEPLGMTYTEDGVIHLNEGGHQYAAWEVGQIPDYEGWHLNVRVIDEAFDVSSLEPYTVYPVNPKCIWA